MIDTSNTCVIGAGIAGQAICRATTRPGRDLSTVLIDPRGLQNHDRFWVYPERNGSGSSADLNGTEIRDIQLGESAIAPRESALRAMSSNALYEATRDRLHNSKALSLIDTARVEAIEAGPSHVTVQTSKGPIRCRYVFDTRPDGGGRITSEQWAVASWSAWIASDAQAQPRFRLSPAEIIDGGVEFVQRTSLQTGCHIERVRICAPGDDAPGLRDRLESVLGNEAQQSPLGRNVWPILPPQSDTRSGRVYSVRAGAGGLRFTSGMEAARLQAWSEDTAHRLMLGATPAPLRRANLASRIGHHFVQRAFRAGPDRGAAYVNAMMSALTGDDALWALAGQPGWSSLIKLMMRRA